MGEKIFFFWFIRFVAARLVDGRGPRFDHVVIDVGRVLLYYTIYIHLYSPAHQQFFAVLEETHSRRAKILFLRYINIIIMCTFLYLLIIVI